MTKPWYQDCWRGGLVLGPPKWPRLNSLLMVALELLQPQGSAVGMRTEIAARVGLSPRRLRNPGAGRGSLPGSLPGSSCWQTTSDPITILTEQLVNRQDIGSSTCRVCCGWQQQQQRKGLFCHLARCSSFFLCQVMYLWRLSSLD